MACCGILNLIKDGDEPGSFCLAADQEAEIKRTLNRNYSLLFFREQDSDYLYKSYYEEEPASDSAVLLPHSGLGTGDPRAGDHLRRIGNRLRYDEYDGRGLS